MLFLYGVARPVFARVRLPIRVAPRIARHTLMLVLPLCRTCLTPALCARHYCYCARAFITATPARSFLGPVSLVQSRACRARLSGLASTADSADASCAHNSHFIPFRRFFRPSHPLLVPGPVPLRRMYSALVQCTIL